MVADSRSPSRPAAWPWRAVGGALGIVFALGRLGAEA